MPRSRADGLPHAPLVPELDLPRLEPGTARDLRPGAYLDLTALTGVDVSGADLTGLELDACLLREVHADETRLVSSRFSEVRLETVTASGLSAQRSTWREVVLSGSRIGALTLYESELRTVHLDSSRVTYLNASGANLLDVALTDCVIDELDLTEARLTRVAMARSRIGLLRVRGAGLADVDLRETILSEVDDASGLRGAAVSPDQLVLLAPALAHAVGLRVLRP